MQNSRRQHQKQKKQRHDHRRHDPIGQAELGQSYSPPFRRERPLPSVTDSCRQRAGDGEPYASAFRIASVKTPRDRRESSAVNANSSFDGIPRERISQLSGKSAWFVDGCVRHGSAGMTIRSRREVVTFKHPFQIRGVDRLLPAGAYEVVTDEEMIEGLSFASFRRVATLIIVPAATSRGSTMEMISIGSVDLADAQRIDASTPHESSAT
jgi:hypothetical protein